mgnify:CR=1 FL=1
MKPQDTTIITGMSRTVLATYAHSPDEDTSTDEEEAEYEVHPDAFTGCTAAHSRISRSEAPFVQDLNPSYMEEPEIPPRLMDVAYTSVDEVAGYEADAAIAPLARQADIYSDAHTLHYLHTGSYPPGLEQDKDERDRIRRRAKLNYLGEDGQLRHLNAAKQSRIIPPPDQRIPLIAKWHEQCCHFGVKRTLSLLAQHYWWYGMADQVRAVIRNCPVCSRANASFNAKTAHLHPLLVDGLFFRWNIDLAGPIPTPSAHNNVYIFIAIEHLSKYLVAVPIPDKTAATIATTFTERILTIFGSSAQILTDQGSEFQATFQDLCVRHRIDHRITSAHCPQSDGLAERAVQTIKQALRKHLIVDPQQPWDTKLPWIVLAYNCSVQEATKLTPYEVIFARKPIIPPAAAQDCSSPLRVSSPEDLAQLCRQRAQAAENASIIAGANIKIAQHRDALWYARIRGGGYTPKLLEFRAGDLVYLQQASRTHGLQPAALQRIYKVLIPPVAGVLKLQGRDGRTLTTNVRNCAPCNLTNVDLSIDPTLAPPDANLACEECKLPDREAYMLLYDACGQGYHMSCLKPPLTRIPKGSWVCPVCVQDGVTPEQVQQLQAVEEAQPEQRRRMVASPRRR